MTAKNIVLIYNPRAGGLNKIMNPVHLLVMALKKREIELPEAQIRATTCGGDATRLAAEAVRQAAEIVIVCGGDGTINEAVQALVGTKTALALFPTGTANVLAKELKLPRNPQAIADLIASGGRREVSVGLAEKPDNSWQRYFLLMAGIGLDAMIIKAVSPVQKKRWGIGAYVIAGLKTLAAWPLMSFSLHFDQRQCAATFAIVANAANYAAWFKIAPKSRLDSKHLEVCIFNSKSRLIYLGYAFLSLFGAHTISPSVIYQTFTEMKAVSSVPVPVQLDGELAGHLPMRFTCIPQALRIVA